MKHPHEVPKFSFDIEWHIAKLMMRGLPRDWRHIDEVAMDTITEELSRERMLQKFNPHFMLNAYREVLFDFLREHGRLDEGKEVRQLIEELKRRARTEWMKRHAEETGERVLYEYAALAIPYAEQMGECMSMEGMEALMEETYLALTDYRERRTEDRYQIPDVDLFAIVYKQFVEHLTDALFYEKAPTKLINEAREVMLGCACRVSEKLIKERAARLEDLFELVEEDDTRK